MYIRRRPIVEAASQVVDFSSWKNIYIDVARLNFKETHSKREKSFELTLQ